MCQNDPGVECRVYLLHRAMAPGQLERLGEDVKKLGWELCPVTVDGELFAKAPVTKQYPQEMYYRLLTGQLLPQEVKRVLYLDPDILVINPLAPLWKKDLQGCLFAAAAHTGKTELANSVNRVRLGTKGDFTTPGCCSWTWTAAGGRWTPSRCSPLRRSTGRSWYCRTRTCSMPCTETGCCPWTM